MFTGAFILSAFLLGSARGPTTPAREAQSQPAPPAPPKIGDMVPAMQVAAWIPSRPPGMPGPQVEGRENIFVVHFWAGHDAASRHAMPYLAQLHSDLVKRHVVVIALSNEDSEELAGLAERLKLPYWIAADSENQTTESWLGEVTAFPWTYVVDTSGRIIW